MNVPFVDLSRIHKPLEEKIVEEIKSVINRGDFILGNSVKEFENAFAEFCGTNYAVGVANGSDALELILRGYNIGVGDEVITTPNTFFATVSAIIQAGATPRLSDVGKYYNIDVNEIERKITSKTKAIMPVHLYGQPSDMDEINQLAKKDRIKVIEDAAQAHGAKYHNIKTGNLGNAAGFSFYPAKNLGAFGDGGAITTNDEGLVERLRAIRNYGQVGKNDHRILGLNSRLDTIQSVVLNVKLPYLNLWNQQRRDIAKKYFELLNWIELPMIEEDREAVYHLFVIRHPERDKLADHLKKAGISTGLHYPTPIHLQPAFSQLGYHNGDFPIAEKYAKEILSLPIFPGMTDEEVEYVAKAVNSF